MTDADEEDTLTKLNTLLNKSMILMDSTAENEGDQNKNDRCIIINAKARSGSPHKTLRLAPRKSILKKLEKTTNENELETNIGERENLDESVNNMITEFSNSVPLLPRPRNLQEFVEGETIVPESTESAFTLDDISDSEDIWIMNIPRTINPQDLNGQTLILGDKSKIKVREERYCAVNHSVKGNVTCVFNTEKLKSKYKTVNIKPAGAIMVRRKLSGITKIKPIDIEQSGVPFPKNLKPRHPLFGIPYEGQVRNDEIK